MIKTIHTKRANMPRYQLFYETTVELLKLKSALKVKHLLSSHQEFASWFKLQTLAVNNSQDLRELYRDLTHFFQKNHPFLRMAEPAL